MPERQATPVMEEHQVVAQQRNGFMRRAMRRGLPLVVVAAAGAGAAYVATGGENHNTATADASGNVPTLVSNPNQALSNCDNLEFDNAAADASSYNSDAFLPSTTVDTPEGAKQYVFNLFSDHGPLAGKGDMESFAAMMSTVYGASHQGGFENTNYDYIDQFNKALGRYQGVDGRDRARDDCKNLFNTLTQDVGYNDNWANSGETVTQFAAVRDNGDNHITGATMFRGTVKEGVTLEGVEFKLRTTSKGENGYLSVLVSTNSKGVENGTIFIKGLTVQQFNGKSQTKQGKNPAKRTHELHPSNHGQQQIASGLGHIMVRRSSNGGLVLSSGTSSSQEQQSGQSTGGSSTPSGRNHGGKNHSGTGSEGQSGGGGGGSNHGSTEGSGGSASGSGGSGTGGAGSAGGGSGSGEGNGGSGAGTGGSGGGSGGGGETGTGTTTPTTPTETTPTTPTHTTPTTPTETTPTTPTETTPTTPTTPTVKDPTTCTTVSPFCPQG